MAAQKGRTAFPDDEELDDDDSQAEDDDVFDDDANSASTSSSLPIATPVPPTTAAKSTVTVAVHSSRKTPSDPPPPVSTTALSTVLASPVPISQRFDTPNDSRKLFQRLWTDEDEIELLQGFLDYTTQRGAGHHDTSLFYDQIRSKLQLDFNKNQLVEKLRRLKKKYRNVVSKISTGKDVAFKSPHDKATFEISRKIWTNIATSRGPVTDNFEDDDDNINHNTHTLNLNHNFHNPNPNSDDARAFSNPKKRARTQSVAQLHQVKIEERNTAAIDGPSATTSMIEETVRSCLPPLLKELVNGASTGGGGMKGVNGFQGGLFNPSLLSFGGPSIPGFGTSTGGDDERWKKQQIFELEVFLKRLELMQDQIKAKLDELRSTRG